MIEKLVDEQSWLVHIAEKASQVDGEVVDSADLVELVLEYLITEKYPRYSGSSAHVADCAEP